MGLYFRKSVRVGPLRFNFSKSGIGVSAGIPGLRVGVGPRGHYVHAGMGGIYYRSSLGDNRLRTAPPRRTTSYLPTPARPSVDHTLGDEVAIESGSVLEMSDSTAKELLDDLNAKQRVPALAPWIAGVVLVLGLIGFGSLAPMAPFVVVGIAAAAWIALRQWDALRTTTVIMYDLEPEAAHEFEQLGAGLLEFAHTQRLWHISTTAAVLDPKYHAGASSNVRRAATSLRMGSPPRVRTNLDVPQLGVGRQTLYFFPERVLVFDRNAVGAVSYGALRVERGTTRFIESDSVASDARVVDHTWQYVNKRGGPDRRFSNNRQLPVCLYETIHLTSSSGLNELLHASRLGAGEPLSRAIARTAARFAQTERRSADAALRAPVVVDGAEPRRLYTPMSTPV